MKKMNYLFWVLFFCFQFPISVLSASNVIESPAKKQMIVNRNQNVLPDYAAKKEALDEMKAVREMIMRSNNHTFKAIALQQLNEQMRNILSENKAETFTQPVPPIQNKQKTRFSGNSFRDKNALQRQTVRKFSSTGQERNKVPVESAMKYRLDSMIVYTKNGLEWLPSEMQKYGYNDNSKVTSNSFLVYNMSGGWNNNERNLIAYNESGQITMDLSQHWNVELARWVDNYKILSEYDKNGNLLKTEAYSEQFNEQVGAYVIVGQWKNEYGYDDNNNQNMYIFYNWDDQIAAWIPISKNEYRFENGFEMMFSGYMWSREENKWIGHWKFEHTSVPGLPILNTTYFHWDYVKDQWNISEKTEFVLSSDNSGTVVTETRWTSHFETGDTIFTAKSTYTKPFGQIKEDLYASFGSIINYQWDTQNENWMFSSKTYNTFDSFGNITQRNDSIWRFTGIAYEWIIDLTIDANVNASGKISDYQVSNWHFDGLSNYIYEKFQYLNTYNDKLELIAQVQQGWDSDGLVWKNRNRIEYRYNDAGQTIEQIWYDSYDPQTLQWTPNRKIEMAVNWNGTEALHANYEWDLLKRQWKLMYKYENYMDAYGEVVLESNIKWNDILNKEIIHYRSEKTFDEHRNLTMESVIQNTTYWEGMEYKIHYDGHKTINIFDTIGRLFTIVKYNYVDGNFVVYKKYEYAYYAHVINALDSEIEYVWEDGWVKTKKSELISNLNVTRNELILPFNDAENSSEVMMYFNYKAMQMIEYRWSLENGVWVENVKTDLFYTQSDFSSLEEISPIEVSVYPNPVSDFISVRLSESSTAAFRLYDMQGRILHESQVNSNSKIDMSKFNKGVYFYRIIMDKETISGKLLKK